MGPRTLLVVKAVGDTAEREGMGKKRGKISGKQINFLFERSRTHNKTSLFKKM
jgi:hypothetical protein